MFVFKEWEDLSTRLWTEYGLFEIGKMRNKTIIFEEIFIYRAVHNTEFKIDSYR